MLKTPRGTLSTPTGPLSLECYVLFELPLCVTSFMYYLYIVERVAGHDAAVVEVDAEDEGVVEHVLDDGLSLRLSFCQQFLTTFVEIVPTREISV